MRPFIFDPEAPKPLPGPACHKCGLPTHLVSVEPHTTYNNLDNHVFECVCGERTAAAVQRV